MSDKPFKIVKSMPDYAFLQHIGRFVHEKRIAANISQAQLSASAGISRSTLSLLERGETVTLSTLIQVLRALDQLHVLEAFNVEQVISPIELAKLEHKQRRRASKGGTTLTDQTNW